MEKEPFPAPQEKPFSFARVAALFCILAGGIMVCAALMVMSSSGDNDAPSQPVTVAVQPTPVAPAPTDKASPSEQAKAIVAAATAQKDEQPAPALPKKPEPPQIKNLGEDFILGSFRYRIISALKTSMIGASDFESQFIDELGKAPEMQIARLFGIDPVKAATGEGTRNANSSYYVIRYEITNLGKTVDAVSNTDFQVIDSQDRQFTPSTDATMKLIERQDEDFLLSELQPGITRACAQAFELPNDAFIGPLHLQIPEKGFFKSGKVHVLLNKTALETEHAGNVQNKRQQNALPKTQAAGFSALTFSELSSRESGDAIVLMLAKDTELRFRFCRSGKFTMGSAYSELDRRPDEDQAEVVFSSGFWMSELECTQKQWAALMPDNPSHELGDNLPVNSVSWEDANVFINKLNTINDLPSNWEINWKFTLPSEAQWEYACRAGVSEPFNNGKRVQEVKYTDAETYALLSVSEQERLRIIKSKAGISPLDSSGWCLSNSAGKLHEVGIWPGNSWGLQDMHGNLSEWCADYYSPKLVGGNEPCGPNSGSERVIRGGSYLSRESEARSAARSRLKPTDKYSSVGFRVAIVSRHHLRSQEVVSDAATAQKIEPASAPAFLGIRFTGSDLHVKVVSGGPLDREHTGPGRITSIAGQKPRDAAHAIELLSKFHPNDEVALTFFSDIETIWRLKIRLDERPRHARWDEH
jgi:formylglycine-generating enzyme required for sulfatase activity